VVNGKKKKGKDQQWGCFLGFWVLGDGLGKPWGNFGWRRVAKSEVKNLGGLKAELHQRKKGGNKGGRWGI